MTISLTPELESLINRKVKSGQYNSAGEVVRESLRLLDEQDRLRELRLEDLRKEIKKGEDEIKAGRFITVETDEDAAKLRARIKENGRLKLEERRRSRQING